MAWYGGSYYYDEPEAVPPVSRLEDAKALPAWQEPRRFRTGLVLGRFLPPHLGHQYLIDFARARVGQLTIAVRSQSEDSIPISQRVAWLRSLFPDCRVIDHDQYGSVEAVFSSQPEHRSFAQALGAEFVLLDPERRVVPISGTQIRQSPLRHWDFLPDCVRPFFVKVVRIIGAEGSGKTTLCRSLAGYFQTCFVPEFAALLAERNGGLLYPADLITWAEQHLAAVESLRRQARRLLFLDTDLLTVAIWGERLYGESPPWIRQQLPTYDETLLLEPRLQGYTKAQREERMEMHTSLMHLTTQTLAGSAESLLEKACQYLEERFDFHMQSNGPRQKDEA